ncbi:type II toxin-antitoxin system Phd/YefM family antitoxin [Verrucomicrobium sp. 3C]|uniref:type II toxin-antitoxin system Phd/YefM family antitoxin n=1 Tax=Verrucomicrobium sp. 3C TaxID=1134055 RepID=UPI000478467C|nr:type II toxin-antitoxin system prevent-host-death family antitoxin [Verrucomicrobium sp. 3C]
MRKASVTEAKNNLSALIDSLKSGQPVLIVDRGRPVARLEPARGDSREEQEGKLSRLVRQGLVRPGRGPMPSPLLRSQPPRTVSGASALEALLEERRQGR